MGSLFVSWGDFCFLGFLSRGSLLGKQLRRKPRFLRELIATPPDVCGNTGVASVVENSTLGTANFKGENSPMSLLVSTTMYTGLFVIQCGKLHSDLLWGLGELPCP